MAEPSTRLATLPPWAARGLLAALALLAALGAAVAEEPPHAGRSRSGGPGDAALYQAIAERTRAGGGTPDAYYAAATAEQRARGYPLRPFVTVREPTLALFSARLGPDATLLAFRLLALATAAAVVLRLRGGRIERAAAATLAATATAILAQPSLAVWHEAWACLLVTLALAIRSPRRWWPACLAGLAALLVRELATPMILALAMGAWAGRRRGEAIGWAATLAVLAVAMAFQAHMVAANLVSGDPASPGWARMGGWGFVLASLHATSLLAALPAPVSAAAVPLALLGWAARGDGFADGVALALGAFLAAVAVVGRSDNIYWGMMVAPLLPVGLAFAPRALADAVRAARQAGRATPWSAGWRAEASS